MLRIQRSLSNGEDLVFTLSGRIQADDVVELQRLLSSEATRMCITLDLQHITLVDSDAVNFLARCEAGNVQLGNCPAYIRQWIDRGRGGNRQES